MNTIRGVTRGRLGGGVQLPPPFTFFLSSNIIIVVH